MTDISISNSGVISSDNEYSFNHTVNVGSDRYLLVAVEIRDNDNPANRPVTGITANGDAMTLLKARSYTDADGDDTRAEIWGLPNPDTGTIAIVVTHTGTVDHAAAGGLSFNGADQSTTPNATAEEDNPFGVDPSLPITTTVDGALIMDACYHQDGADLTPALGQTVVSQLGTNGGGDRAVSSYKILATAGGTTMAWTNGGAADANVIVAVAIGPATASAPTVTTSAASSVTGNSAVGNGNVTSDGGATVTERGFAYGTSANPTTAGSKVVVAGTTGAYTGDITGLSPNTLYHYRAYATNSEGTSYGADTEFTTSAATVPTVSNGVASQITKNSVVVAGNVTSAGGSVIVERGFVLSTSPTPTINDTKFLVGGGTGSFSLQITKLKARKTYYVRAFARNSYGVSYG